MQLRALEVVEVSGEADDEVLAEVVAASRLPNVLTIVLVAVGFCGQLAGQSLLHAEQKTYSRRHHSHSSVRLLITGWAFEGSVREGADWQQPGIRKKLPSAECR